MPAPATLLTRLKILGAMLEDNDDDDDGSFECGRLLLMLVAVVLDTPTMGRWSRIITLQQQPQQLL